MNTDRLIKAATVLSINVYTAYFYRYDVPVTAPVELYCRFRCKFLYYNGRSIKPFGDIAKVINVPIMAELWRLCIAFKSLLLQYNLAVSTRL